MSGKKEKAYRVKITETRAITVEVEAENELIAKQRVNAILITKRFTNRLSHRFSA